jgi:1-acyl-sn-glycerol-3-phosphate acyltransferase
VAKALTLPFVRYEIRGGACAPRLHVGIIAANHRSLFDVVAGLIGLHHFERYPRLLIASQYVNGRWTGPFARAIGAIPVERGESGRVALDAAFAALRDGVPILVMPEGRLHWDPDHPYDTGPARPGVSRLAVGGHVVVVPAGLVGTERVWPADKRLPRLNPFRRKRVVINVADVEMRLQGDDHQANTELVMAEIRRLIRAADDPAPPRSG